MIVKFLMPRDWYDKGQICTDMPGGMAEEYIRRGIVEEVKDGKDKQKKLSGAKPRSAA